MPNSNPSERIDAKHEQNRRERLAGIKRWVEHVRERTDTPEAAGSSRQRTHCRAHGRATESRRNIDAFGRSQRPWPRMILTQLTDRGSCHGADLSPADDWLGTHSEAAAIRQSGLWNVTHVDEESDPAFLDTVAEHVSRTTPP